MKTLEKLSNLETRLYELEQKVLGLTPTDKKKEYCQNYKEESTHIDSSKSKESEIHPQIYLYE